MRTTAPAPRVLVAGYIPSVATIAARLLKRDGMYHHGDRYFAAPGDAALARRLAATRLRADAARGVPRALQLLRALLRPVAGESAPAGLRPDAEEVTCVWCRRALPADALAEQLGGRLVHPACGLAFFALMGGDGEG